MFQENATTMHLTRQQRNNLRACVARLESSQVGIGEMLASVSEMLDADHAEFSIWQFEHDGTRSMLRINRFDPAGSRTSISLLPNDEQRTAGSEATVHTWTLEIAPGWGGPALLSTRPTGDGTVALLTLGRTRGRRAFSGRDAILIDVFHRSSRFANLMAALYPPQGVYSPVGT